jgi:hypothetical protein
MVVEEAPDPGDTIVAERGLSCLGMAFEKCRESAKPLQEGVCFSYALHSPYAAKSAMAVVKHKLFAVVEFPTTVQPAQRIMSTHPAFAAAVGAIYLAVNLTGENRLWCVTYDRTKCDAA